MKRDEGTYGRIGKQYDEYTEIVASKPAAPVTPRGLPPQKPYVPAPQEAAMGRTVFAAIGMGIGAILLLLAVYAFVTAAGWGALGQDGAAVGYTLVGFFLTLAGVGGILSTYNHNFRVLNRTGGGHH
jgi:hypothetical protein